MTGFWTDTAVHRVLRHPTDFRALRESATAFLADCSVESITDAMLVADALATAAYDQGRLPATIRLVREGRRPNRLRITVAAEGVELPGTGSPGTGFGTGLHVLTTCAALWGRSGAGRDTALWAHLPLTTAAPVVLDVALHHGVAAAHRPAGHP